jgi:cytochrome c-type biogenesis protein CcmH/NrfG
MIGDDELRWSKKKRADVRRPFFVSLLPAPQNAAPRACSSALRRMIYLPAFFFFFAMVSSSYLCARKWEAVAIPHRPVTHSRSSFQPQSKSSKKRLFFRMLMDIQLHVKKGSSA